jgi:hypothetical protein
MRRKKHSSRPSHTAPPGAAVIKRGELFEVVFSRRDSRIATFGETAADAAAKAWRFWNVGGKPATRFADLLHKALN